MNVGDRSVFQDARLVRTKNAKTFVSGFFPVNNIYVEVIDAWMIELGNLGFGPDDPLFPARQSVSGRTIGSSSSA